MLALKKVLLLLLSTLAGVVAGVTIATPVIAALNRVATDGPGFPPALVALGMLAIPIGVLLLPVHGLAVGYELAARRSLGWTWLLLAPVAGAAAGLYWSFQINPAPSDLVQPAAVTAFGMLQALSASAVHWVAHRRRFAQPAPAAEE